MADGLMHNLEQHKLDQDLVRERNQRHKWHLGEASPSVGHPSRRPNKPATPAGSRFWRREATQLQNKNAKTGRFTRRHPGCVDTDTDTSSLESNDEARSTSPGPAPDAGYTYSFDAATGPSKGSQILGQAIVKAVEKYETKEMDKLVKNEYEIVENEHDEAAVCTSNVEDGFELIG